MTSLPPGHIRFAFTPVERDDLEKFFPARQSPVISFIDVAICGLVIIVAALDAHHSVRSIAEVAVGAAGMVFSAGVGISALRQRRVAATGSLDVKRTGFAGMLDGTPVTLEWQDITGVRDVEDAIVLIRRGTLAVIALPKRDINDPATLWDFLEDRLVSKRGLIRSAAPRRAIANSAY